MIPKILHQIWVGYKKIPIEFINFSNSWKKMYSDFEYILWDDDLVDNDNIIPNEKLKYYKDNTYYPAFKADILRYEILKKYGGLYIDMDTEPLKRMDDEIFQYEFFSGIQGNGCIAIGIMGSEPNSVVINSICNGWVDNVNNLVSQNPIHKQHLDLLTGPSYFTSICEKYKYFNNPNFKFFESKFFYPYWFTEKHRRYENFKETCTDAYSVHHWAGSWYE